MEWCDLSLRQYTILSLDDYANFVICASSSIDDLFARRKPITTGGNPINFVELVGGKDILYLWYQPDPITTRDQFWYDTRNNILYRKFKIKEPVTGGDTFYWRQISECK